MASVILKDILKADSVLIRAVDEVLREHLSSVSNGNAIQIDFTDIQALSRAFAHSLISLSEEFKNKGVELDWTNANQAIQAMLTLVRDSRSDPTEHVRPDLIATETSLDEASNQF